MFRSDFVLGLIWAVLLLISATAPVKADSVQTHLVSKHLTGVKGIDFQSFNPDVSLV